MDDRILVDANGRKYIMREPQLHPHLREWISLTDEDIAQACGFGEHTTTSLQHMLIAIARAIEAKCKDKNT
jgi:hypothetical protein